MEYKDILYLLLQIIIFIFILYVKYYFSERAKQSAITEKLEEQTFLIESVKTKFNKDFEVFKQEINYSFSFELEKIKADYSIKNIIKQTHIQEFAKLKIERLDSFYQELCHMDIFLNEWFMVRDDENLDYQRIARKYGKLKINLSQKFNFSELFMGVDLYNLCDQFLDKLQKAYTNYFGYIILNPYTSVSHNKSNEFFKEREIAREKYWNKYETLWNELRLIKESVKNEIKRTFLEL